VDNLPRPTVRIVSFVNYPTRPPWRKGDLDAIKFVRTVKGRSLGECARPRQLGKLCGLDTKNGGQALEWFARLAALVLSKLRRPLVLVPIPSSDCRIESHMAPHTLRLAQAVATHMKNAVVSDVLRWKQPMRPTHEGGTRDARKLYDELVPIGDLPERTVILIDDVFTTGGHILAAAAKISTAGGHCCDALCVARTVWRPQESRFSITQEMVSHVLTQFPRCPPFENRDGWGSHDF